MTYQISNTEDTIDSRDIIARIEELEGVESILRDSIDECQDAYDFHDSDDTQSTPEFHDLEEARKALADWLECEDAAELKALKAVAAECENYSDWEYGEQLIRRSYFVQYITDLIDDCYEMPKEINSGSWPYRHITIDYEAAADDAEQDYSSVDFDGVEYLIRSV